MSYLNPTRVHFAGLFRADVSTVNNEDLHFNSATFKPNDQNYGDNTNNGWWQPSGTGAWRLSGCAISGAAWNGKFATSSLQDPAIGLQLKNSSDRVDAKLVDLDPDQQMVSMIFGLQVRIADPVSGAVLMTGELTPVPFMDMWVRGGGGDTAASVFYHSTLTGVVWGDLSKSPALQALQAATLQGQLSIRFMLDRYAMGRAKRGYGRIVGTIGPALAGEPAHFVAGRHLASINNSPLGNVTCCLDPAGTQILADFGNALPSDRNGNVPNLANIHLVAVKNVAAIKNGASHLAAADIVDLGSLLGYDGPDYYLHTAGIQAFPPDGSLTAAQLQAQQTLPLAAMQSDGAGGGTVWAAEAPDGIFARADMFVYRINPGDKGQVVPIKVTQFGQPLAGQTVVAKISSNSIGGTTLPVSTPATALQLDFSGLTGADGWTNLTITGSDPGQPRGFVDGQVYEIDLSVTGAANAGTAFNSWLFISVLLFSETTVPDTVTWNGDVLPILQQYANLYPRPHGAVVNYDPKYPGEPNPMPLLHPVISLTDKDWVASFAPRILTALGLPLEHPNHMPVTRDLSAGRRGILKKWMQQVIAGTIPLEPGPGPGPVIPTEEAMRVNRATPAAAPREQLEMPDSKTAAMRRIKSGAALKPDAK